MLYVLASWVAELWISSLVAEMATDGDTGVTGDRRTDDNSCHAEEVAETDPAVGVGATRRHKSIDPHAWLQGTHNVCLLFSADCWPLLQGHGYSA